MTETDYAARIAAAHDDAAELGRIADELQGVPGQEAGRLRFRAISRRMALRGRPLLGAGRPLLGQGTPASPGTTTARAPPPPPPLLAPPTPSPPWLAQLGIQRVPGRPLHRYGLSQEGFDALAARVRAKGILLSHSPGRETAGQFVLWAAEWFRRCYDGSGQRWDALGGALGVRCGWGDWRRLTDLGMQFWGIEPLRIRGTHHRLAAIARQGGFPVAALERAAGGWAPRFFEALVGTLVQGGVASLDAADAAAEQLMGLVPETWRNREIRIVSAELALEVVRLRGLALADGVPPGALVTPWLDQHQPGWREQLPISIGSDAARALIDGLMRAVTLQGGAGAVGCTRWLEAGPGGRRELVELSLSGRLVDGSGRAIARNLAEEWSRLRLYAAGPLARHVAGELAVLDPDEGGSWLARPAIARPLFEVPLDVAAAAELRGAGQRVTAPFVLAGGEPVPDGLRVYAAEQAEPGAPMRLRLLGTGSGAYREESLHLDLPPGWSAEPHGEGASCEPMPGEDGGGARKLARIEGTAIATSPRGDRYLVRAGQKAGQRDRLAVVGQAVRGCTAAEPSVPVLSGPLSFHLKEGPRDRGGSRDEIWWRPAGSAGWRTDPARAGPGACEFAWRDRVTGHLRDRRDAIIVPPAFAIQSGRAGAWSEVGVSGWPGTLAGDAGTSHEGTRWRFPAKANPVSRLALTLGGAEGGPFVLHVPVHHQAWIESWTDGPVGAGTRLSLSTVQRYVARVSGRCELLADLLDRNGRPVPHGSASWWIEDELALSSIRDDLAALLRPSGEIRATIRLNFNDANEDHWYVGEFEHELEDERGGLVPRPVVAEEDVRLAGRRLADPGRESDLATYCLSDLANHRPIDLPRLRGDWLVYLRAGGRVLSCPRLVLGEPSGSLAQTALGRVMALGDWHARQVALRAACDDAMADLAGPACRAFVGQVKELALSLDGLPPATFDILRLLSERPQLAASMVFQARRDEIEPLLRLAEGLAFAWWLVPRRCWYAAAAAKADYLYERIADEHALVAGSVSELRVAIASFDPVLAPLLELGRQPRPIEDLALEFLDRSGDRIERARVNPFRPRLDVVLPQWRYLEDYRRALDAPIAAARAAREEIVLEPGELACAKDVARRHPRWFEEAFAAALVEI